MKDFAANSNFVSHAQIPVEEREKKYKYQPEINTKSVRMVNKMKENGKFGNNAIEHMTSDVEKRKENVKRAFVIEVKAENNMKKKVNLNEKSNRLLANKFKQEFDKTIVEVIINRNTDNEITYQEYIEVITRMGFLFQDHKEGINSK